MKNRINYTKDAGEGILKFSKDGLLVKVVNLNNRREVASFNSGLYRFTDIYELIDYYSVIYVGDKDMQKYHDREVKNFFREEEL